MNLRVLGLTLLLGSTTALAVDRKPAVEDFVGIEVNEPAATPQGTEPLFNLEHDLNKMNEAQVRASHKKAPVFRPEAPSMGVSGYLVVVAILGMPMVSSFLILNHLRQKAKAESHSNIEVLEKYRKQKELARAKDEQKKAS